jgi:cyclopropane-fatty-acyl-phospholipid synthase
MTALSNSKSQKAYIDEEAAKRGFANLNVITADVSAFDTEKR